MRPSARSADELRPIRITRDYIKHAEGSVLIEFGDTRVICTASVDNSVPGFLRGKGRGWVTAEYGMLPRSTGSRMRREANVGKQGGRLGLEVTRSADAQDWTAPSRTRQLPRSGSRSTSRSTW